MITTTMEEMNYDLESDDEFIFTEVIAGFLQAELAKEIGNLQAKSLNATNYNRKKHLVSFLIHAKEKAELDEFKDLFEANLSYDDSLLRNSTDSECLLVKTSSNYLSKLCIKLIDEAMLKCVDFLEYLNTGKENAFSNDTNIEIKKERNFVPRPHLFSMSNLNRCNFCSFKHFSKSVVQCHMSKNHLQHLRTSRLNRNVNNGDASNLAEPILPTSLTLSDMINENNNIVYNNQNDLNISLNNSLYNALGNGGDEEGDDEGGIGTSMDDAGLDEAENNEIPLSNATNNSNHANSLTGNAKLPCPYCDKTFTYQSLLTQHIRIHTGEKPFKCKLCNKQFSQRPTLNRHFKIHTNDRSFCCEICGKSFLHRCNLTKHMESHMRPVEKKISSILASSKAVEIDLTSETSTTEKKKEPTSNSSQTTKFYCRFCSKLFTYQSQLEQHERIHTGERPFTCNICHKSFSQRPTLNRHMKVHSNGRKAFFCKICNEQFHERWNFNQHLAMHARN